jgi:hypothetical protein
MNFGRRPQVRGLYHWLEIATEKIASPAKERIRSEIEAHYAEALAGHVAEGQTETDAKAAALADLGDPKTAARRLRRQHLTEREAGLADCMLRYERSGVSLAFACLVFGLIYRNCRDQGLLIPGFLGFVVFPAVSFIIARRKVVRMSVLVLTECLDGCVVAAVVYMMGLWPIYRLDAWVAVLVMGFACVVRPLRLWYKLRRAGDDWQEMPTE